MRYNVIEKNCTQSDPLTASKFAVLLHSTFPNKCATEFNMSIYFNGMNDRNASKYVPHRQGNTNVDTRSSFVLFRKHFIQGLSKRQKFIMAELDKFKLLVGKQTVNF